MIGGAQYITLPSKQAPQGDFVLEVADVVFTGIGVQGCFYSHYNATGNQRGLLFDYLGQQSTKQLRLCGSVTGTDLVQVVANFTPVVGTTYQIAAERAGSTVRLYVNGQPLAITGNATMAGSLHTSTDVRVVGASRQGSSYSTVFPGSAGGIRLQLSAPYQGPYTPPSVPFP